MTSTIDETNKYIYKSLSQRFIFQFQKANENHSMNFSWLVVLIKVLECSFMFQSGNEAK